ncbi:MAG: efflux transporter outer membrane subunit [Methylocella sp.]|jgi:NodT family efflux transporter outer membrane factor (OMF) lipoprotein
MLDRIRRRVGAAGISLRGLFVAGDRLRPALRLCATLSWREIDKAERQAGQRGAVIGLGWGFVAALLVSLAGCAVGPDFTPPLAPVADTWLEWRNKSLQTGPEEYRDWWRVFHDPILDRLIDIAYSQNLTLLSAGTKVLQARAQLGIAIGEFWPQKQGALGTASYNLLSQANAQSSPASGVGQSSPSPGLKIINFWSDGIGVQAAWELDFWGKFRRGVESADSAYLGSIATYDDVLVTLLGDVASTYVGIRTLEKQIAIARENVVKQRGILQIARDRYKGGAATLLDVYQAENILGTTEATVPQLTIQLQQGLNALRVLLGMAPEPLGFLLARSTGHIPATPPKVVVGVPADLLRRRPDIRAAELKAAAQSAQVGVAAADLYPAISISGAFGGLASNVGGHNLWQAFHPVGQAFSVGPSFQWNLLNYGQITNNVRLQDATLQEYLVDYQNTVLKAQQEVENGISTFLLSRSQAEYLHRSVVAANGALHIATLEYQQGTRDFTTVLTAEQNLYQAENNLAMATGNISTGLVSVFRALGGGWQIRDGNGFLNAATTEEMRSRTNWGQLLPPASEPPLPAPGLPGPEDRGPTVRAPEW